MKHTTERKYYYYTIALDTEMWPRKLASYLDGESQTMHRHLKSVTDLQNDKHIYGRTYRVGVPLDRQVVPANLKRLQAELATEVVGYVT